MKENIGALEIFNYPALEFSGRRTTWKLLHDKLFDFSNDGNREWQTWKDRIKLSYLDRPMLALKQHYGISSVPTDIKELLKKYGDSLGRKNETPFLYLKLSRQEFKKLFKYEPTLK